jgi:hypothetical protein
MTVYVTGEVKNNTVQNVSSRNRIGVVDSSASGQDQWQVLVNMAMSLQVP